MKALLRKVPVVFNLAKRGRSLVHRHFGTRRLRRDLRTAPARLVIGASGVCENGWIPTDVDYLNLLVPGDWKRFFQPNGIDALLAEHVWEHLCLEDGAQAAAQCFEYLKPGGYLRIAVPDGYCPNPSYIDAVRVGGTGLGADDHKVLYTSDSLTHLLERAGYEVVLLEHYDAAGQFHHVDWDPKDGMVHRSRRYDERNADGRLNYTSLIVDAFKPAHRDITSPELRR